MVFENGEHRAYGQTFLDPEFCSAHLGSSMGCLQYSVRISQLARDHHIINSFSSANTQFEVEGPNHELLFQSKTMVFVEAP